MPVSLTRDQVTFVFVRPQFATNLGSSIRVIGNMGFRQVALVRPECEVGMEARSFAMRAVDLLDSALFYPSLEAAAEQLGLLAGTTGRLRGDVSRVVDLRSFAQETLEEVEGGSLGVVFGPEDNGLSHEELALCHWRVEIPTGSNYPILNLAQSVGIVAYELNLALAGQSPSPASRNHPQERQALMDRVADLLADLDLPAHAPPERILNRLRRLLHRTSLEPEDVRMLHGLLRHIQEEKE